jgi:hypothetical protein
MCSYFLEKRLCNIKEIDFLGSKVISMHKVTYKSEYSLANYLFRTELIECMREEGGRVNMSVCGRNSQSGYQSAVSTEKQMPQYRYQYSDYRTTILYTSRPEV